MYNAKSCSTPMVLSNKLSLHDSEAFSHPSLYRSTIGALQYLTLTCPDLAFSVNKLSQFLHAPTVAQWGACKRILQYIKGTLTHGLTFTPTQFLTLEGYADADWASNLDDRKSVSSICVFLGGNLITWSSKKQQVVARSSTEAEYRALATAATDFFWVQNLLTEIGISLHPQPSILWSDNLGAQALTFSLGCLPHHVSQHGIRATFLIIHIIFVNGLPWLFLCMLLVYVGCTLSV